MAKPVVKWAGGKSRLIKYIKPLLPNKFNTYIEPFFGGGALFFHLKPKKAIINDINIELMNLYNTIRVDVRKFNKKLEEFANLDSEEFFYKLRGWDRNKNFKKNYSNIERSARLVFLNKTCYGGIYRVNSKGFFNTPYAKKINGKKILDIENNTLVNRVLKNTKIYSIDYKGVLSDAKKGDFVFIDPPYLPWSVKKASFTNYDKDGFGIKEHHELAKEIKTLTKNGVFVMATNHATNLVKEIYKDLNFHKIPVSRTVSCNAKTKSGYYEYIMTNY